LKKPTIVSNTEYTLANNEEDETIDVPETGVSLMKFPVVEKPVPEIE
jgi:hypothetical protein